MPFLQQMRQTFMALSLVAILIFTTACAGVSSAKHAPSQPGLSRSGDYSQSERGNNKLIVI